MSNPSTQETGVGDPEFSANGATEWNRVSQGQVKGTGPGGTGLLSWHSEGFDRRSLSLSPAWAT